MSRSISRVSRQNISSQGRTEERFDAIGESAKTCFSMDADTSGSGGRSAPEWSLLEAALRCEESPKKAGKYYFEKYGMEYVDPDENLFT